MKGLTNDISERPWSDIISEWYVRVDETYPSRVTQRGAPLRLSGPEPELADSEVITISLVIETFFNYSGRSPKFCGISAIILSHECFAPGIYG